MAFFYLSELYFSTVFPSSSGYAQKLATTNADLPANG
jgi:hypothetical protein